MATDSQIEANRRNFRRSTGPRTDAGKARSSANATRHGILAKTGRTCGWPTRWRVWCTCGSW